MHWMRFGTQAVFGLLALTGFLLYLFGNAVLLRLGIVAPEVAQLIEPFRWAWLAIGVTGLGLALHRRPAGGVGFVLPLAALVLGLGAGVGGAVLFPAQYAPVPAAPAAHAIERASFAPDDWVLGVSLGEKAKAYPWSYIQQEFVINDEIAGEPVVVTYCISCNSSLAYRAEFEDRTVRFGVVGVYRTETLLYDQATGSWWKEDGSAIAGALKGTQLEQLPAALMPWSEWVNLYPQTQVVLR